jgi:hypothetical protein
MHGVDTDLVVMAIAYDDSGAGTAFPARRVEVTARTTQHRPAPEERAKPTAGTEDSVAATEGEGNQAFGGAVPAGELVAAGRTRRQVWG